MHGDEQFKKDDGYDSWRLTSSVVGVVAQILHCVVIGRAVPRLAVELQNGRPAR